MDMKAMGQQLRELRQALGMSLTGAAARTGFASVVIGSYERADRRPNVEQLSKLLAAYGHELVVAPFGATIVPPGVPAYDTVMTDGQIASTLRGLADRVEARLHMPDPAELAALRGKLVEQRAGGES